MLKASSSHGFPSFRLTEIRHNILILWFQSLHLWQTCNNVWIRGKSLELWGKSYLQQRFLRPCVTRRLLSDVSIYFSMSLGFGNWVSRGLQITTGRVTNVRVTLQFSLFVAEIVPLQRLHCCSFKPRTTVCYLWKTLICFPPWEAWTECDHYQRGHLITAGGTYQSDILESARLVIPVCVCVCVCACVCVCVCVCLCSCGDHIRRVLAYLIKPTALKGLLCMQGDELP